MPKHIWIRLTNYYHPFLNVGRNAKLKAYCSLAHKRKKKMETIYWKTEKPHSTNSETMADYLENENMLDILMVDGSYAEGKNCKGEIYEIHASGDGDFCNHKVEFKLKED